MTTVNVYDIGQDIELQGTFTNAAGTAVAPTAVLVVVKKDNGTQVTYKTATGWSSQGNWDAATNTPTLTNGTGTAGHFYTVTAAGTVDFGDGDIPFEVGDQVYYNGDIWQLLPSPSATNVTTSATGIYQVTQHATMAGKWFYNFEGIGSAQGAGEKVFKVRERSAR